MPLTPNLTPALTLKQAKTRRDPPKAEFLKPGDERSTSGKVIYMYSLKQGDLRSERALQPYAPEAATPPQTGKSSLRERLLDSLVRQLPGNYQVVARSLDYVAGSLGGLVASAPVCISGMSAGGW